MRFSDGQRLFSSVKAMLGSSESGTLSHCCGGSLPSGLYWRLAINQANAASTSIVFIFCLIFQQCACQPNIECYADGNRHAERGNGRCAADGEQGKGNGCRRGGKQHAA